MLATSDIIIEVPTRVGLKRGNNVIIILFSYRWLAVCDDNELWMKYAL